MYQIELRRQAYKDLESILADYKRLISEHIDSRLKKTRAQPTQRNSKVTRVIRCGLVLTACFTTLTIKPKW